MYETIDNINQQVYDMNDTINCNYRNIETIFKNLKVLNTKRNNNEININTNEPKQGWQRSKYAHEKKPSDINTNKEDTKEDNIDVKKENNKINTTEYKKNINKDTKQEDKK